MPVVSSPLRLCAQPLLYTELGMVPHSYVSEDKQRTYCIYDGPSPEAIRQAARRSHLPIERITEVRVLDPYFYT